MIGSAVLNLSGCGTVLPSSSQEPIQRTDFLLNTFVDIKLYDTTDITILDDAMALCKDLESRFSRTLEDSEIYHLNHRAPDKQTVELSEQTAELLSLALNYCERSDGAFDITIEPASSLWDFTSGNKVLPDPVQLEDAVSKIGYESLLVEDQTLTFLTPDTTLDLGAIAKGYIADEIKELLVDRGVKSAIINLGGNVLCIGSKPNGDPFKIGLKKPFASESETFAIANIADMSVVTSGVYERYFELDGNHYHHILNPATGYPYENDLLSVTILSGSSADGDGLSTTCFSLGLEAGMELINSLDGIYGCFIDEDYNIYYSEGMEDFLNEA
ncbi:MAG: FAD:protein FMN transferase [Lachnospiraceae bacterium]|nr:FAD:protein FMN transferase [Lachnospiraceae bacterium]